MTRKVATRAVEQGLFANYLIKAEENLRSAQRALEEGDLNAAAVSGVHAAISAADAYCVFSLEKRCAGDSHEDCEALIMQSPFEGRLNKQVARRFMEVVRIKRMAEYEERLVRRPEAERAVADAQALLRLVMGAVE